MSKYRTQDDFPCLIVIQVSEIRFNLNSKFSVISINILCFSSWHSDVGDRIRKGFWETKHAVPSCMMFYALILTEGARGKKEVFWFNLCYSIKNKLLRKSLCFVFGMQKRVSQPWHHWHFELDKSLLGVAQCIARCLVTPVASAH